ncbi:MAG: hypothetical protein JSV84_11425 [Gemmatimonadota bacterium]|nr:MAG: hypothetical protein JSV84_11425 [Gemmatimonadota bacterium]
MASKKPVLDMFQAAHALEYGAKFYKADFHFHTPASEDARGKNRYNFNPYKIKYPPKEKTPGYGRAVNEIQKTILKDARKIAADIVRRFCEVDLSLVAVTDHNGIGTIWADDESTKKAMDLAAPTWYELIDDEARKVNRREGKTVLTIFPGTEISTTGIHILAIFPPQNPRRKVHFMICDLLNEVGFAVDDWGKNPKVGTASPFNAIRLIVQKGGIPILAHIDGSDQAILKLYKINSGAMKNVLRHKQLCAVEIVKPSRFSKKDKKLQKTLKDWIDILRLKEDLTPLAYFQGSDAHDLPTVAKRHTYLKMTEPSFSGFRTAIKMPSSRVRISDVQTPEFEGLYIHSVAVHNSFFGKQMLRFNRHANCITGKKGSGKSYIFDLMQAAVDPEFPHAQGEVTLFIEKLKGAASQYYAFSRSKKDDHVKLYSLGDSATTAQEIDLEQADNLHIQPNFYNAARIEELISSREGLNSFLVKHFGNPTEKNKRRFNKKFSIPSFLREKDEPLLFLESDSVGSKLSVNIQWYTGKPKMRDFFTLSRSLRRTALMCMVIVMSDFGPVIIDAPETHFDNEDIAQFLVPLIKRYKDYQQVILFTNNPLLAVNTDPDNYILLETRGEKVKKIISGFAIDDEHQKPWLLKIMEGSLRSFHRRADRYEINE